MPSTSARSTIGRLAPFYLSAAVSFVCLAIYAACFFLRVGCAHPLEEFELERRAGKASDHRERRDGANGPQGLPSCDEATL